MGQVRINMAMSLDGFVAGPDQSLKDPLGVGGMQLHQWALRLAAWRKGHGLEGGEVNASSRVVEEHLGGVGAVVMGRNMFGGQPGPWREPAWNGWWGEDPPFHTPVFVLTHHPRPPLPMRGGTTFHFVTGGPASALRQAREAAGGQDVLVSGGASAARQLLAARLVDEVNLSVVPVLLGAGERLLDGLGGLGLEQVRVIEAPGVTHLRYRVVR
jgi:dihydrofolate reductase